MTGSLFYGWRIVATAFVILFTAYGAQYCFGVFFAALIADFGWSRTGLAGVFSFYAFTYSVLGFPAGRLTDRLGPRVVIAGGAVFLGAALTAMAGVTALWQAYVLYGLAALGMCTVYVPCHTTVVRWFQRRRGLASGVTSSGASLGTLLLPPLAQVAVTALGWRGAYVVVGVIVFVVVLATAQVMRRDPESMGLHPDGEAPVAEPSAGAASGAGLALREAVRTRALWLLCLAFSATWVPVFVPLVHLAPFARDLGHSPLAAAWAIGATGAGAVLGRLVMGAVSDRVGRRPTIAGGMLLQALAFLGFSVVHDLAALYAAALVFGFSYGTVGTLFAPIVGDFFGRAHAGSIVGFLFMTAGSMAAWGILGAGASFDATGSYRTAFLLAAACNGVAFAVLLACRPPGLRYTPRVSEERAIT